MDYLSQKIKSVPRIEVSPELHRRIMRRAFYQQFRYPLWILIGIAVIRITADALQVINHSLTKVIQSLVGNFGLTPVGIAKISVGVADKALLHPDLIAALIIDFALFSYLLYMLSYIKGANRREERSRFNLNPMAWFRYFIRADRTAK